MYVPFPYSLPVAVSMCSEDILSCGSLPFLACKFLSPNLIPEIKSVCSAKGILMSPLLGKLFWVIFLCRLKYYTFMHLALLLLLLLPGFLAIRYCIFHSLIKRLIHLSKRQNCRNRRKRESESESERERERKREKEISK